MTDTTEETTHYDENGNTTKVTRRKRIAAACKAKQEKVHNNRTNGDPMMFGALVEGFFWILATIFSAM